MKIRGGVAAIAVVFVGLGAACSSGSDKATSTTTTNPGATTSVPNVPVTYAPGTKVTTPGGTVVTTPDGTPVTYPPGTQVTTPEGTGVTTPSPTAGNGTTPPTTAAVAAMRWKLALDFRTAPQKNPFPAYNGGTAVWSLRQSASLARNGNYTLLPTFSSTFGSAGVSAWHGDSGGACVGLPAIGTNVISVSRPLCAASVPPTAAFVQPSATRMPVVQWTSPRTSTVTVTGGLADLDATCGDGVVLFIARGTTTLASVSLANGGSMVFQPVKTRVTEGQSLNFLMSPGPAGDAGCDATQLALTIDQP